MKEKNQLILQFIGSIFMLAICICLNFGGKLLASTLQLPFWLDTVGTCLAAYLLGPIGAVLAGIANNLLLMLFDSVNILYTLVSVIIGLMFCTIARRKYIHRFSSAMISSFVIGIIAIILSTPINLLFTDGLPGNMWADACFSLLEWNGFPKVLSAFLAQTVIEITDKQLCVFLVYLIVRLLTVWFPGIGYYDKKSPKEADEQEGSGETIVNLRVIILAGVIGLTMTGLGSTRVYAESRNTNFLDENYQAIIYDGSTGMPASEANVITETKDGYIWIGSYAGLTRYDGTEFEYITEGGAASVTAMMTDSRDRLWIGTNDNGVVCYENGSFRTYTMEDGLSSNTIRCITEDYDGSIYMGTSDRISKISPNGTISILADETTYVYSLVADNGCLYGVTNTGKLFCIENEKHTKYLIMEDTDDIYTCVQPTPLGLLAATSGSSIHVIDKTSKGLVVRNTLTLGELYGTASIFIDSKRRIWLCADNGLGYLDTRGGVHVNRYPGFESNIESMHEDYEGNLWFASSRYGVLKLARNQFENLFNTFDEPERVVNAVVIADNTYYCGTDSGLVIYSTAGEKIENELTERLEGTRVRSILQDSESLLWFSTYGPDGLVCYDPVSGEISAYNTKTVGATTDRFRCAIELDDGTIAAGTASGINFIRNGRLISRLTTADGLKNGQILCLIQNEDGTIYAGTDGGGISVIRDRQIVDTITAENGLGSGVVMRMTEYAGGYFCITSNAVCYMRGGEVKRLDTFPYFNNYDCMILDGNAYVLSSTGIFVSNAAKLLQDDFAYTLYNNEDGLQGGLTANSWSTFDSDGNIYLCCNDGVIRWENLNRNEAQYLFGIATLEADGSRIRAAGDTYVIPADAKRLEINASVRNYSLTNLKVRMYVEGMADTMQTTSQHELKPLQLTSLEYGDYKLHLQILNDDESEVRQEQVYLIRKEANLWEHGYYQMYLVVVLAWIVSFATWVMVTLIHHDRQRKQLDQLRIRLEEQVTRQTEQIRMQADEMQDFQWSVIENLASIIESRDGNTGEHVINVRQYANLIAEEMHERGLHPEIVDQKFIDDLTYVAPLHDIGKIKVSDLILNKPGRLTPEEFELMKKHTVYGRVIVQNILSQGKDKAITALAEDVALYHHERMDGSGYPHGISGEDIPLAARILAVADVFDALISERVYKKPMSLEAAFELIRNGSGKQFDPEIVEVFLSLESKIRRLQK